MLYPSVGNSSFSTNFFENGVHTGNYSNSIKESIKNFDYRFSVDLIQDEKHLPRKSLNLSLLTKIDVKHELIREISRNYINAEFEVGRINLWRKLCNNNKETYVS